METQNGQVTLRESLDWIAALFEESADEIQPDTPRDHIPTWDSVGVLALMASLDEKFGIVLSDQDLKAMTKVDDILAVLRQHGKLAAA